MGKLTAMAVKAAKRPGRYIDGQGLMLVVKESGARSWQLRIQVEGKRRDFGLGSLSEVTLSEARERALETRKKIRAGWDPSQDKTASTSLKTQIKAFREIAAALHDERKGDWRNKKHKEQWLSSLKAYAFPYIGDVSVEDIAGPQIRDLLLPIWQEKPETARRVMQRVGKVLDWAYANGLRTTEAPLRSVRAGLPRQLKSADHFAAMPYEQVGSFIKKLAENDTVGRLALRFLIFTAARSGEVRGATWGEVDLERGLWTVPAERMKAKKEHVVPLSKPALDVLKIAAALRTSRAADEPLFPGMKGGALSDMTLTKVLRTVSDEQWTVHGFRSSFRDWAAERTSFSSEVAETALAHAIPNKVVAAYRRTNFLEKRQEMMAQWAAYLLPSEVGNITP